MSRFGCICDAVVGFHEAVRSLILHSLTTTFLHLQKTHLAQSLRLDGSALDDLVTSASPVFSRLLSPCLSLNDLVTFVSCFTFFLSRP